MKGIMNKILQKKVRDVEVMLTDVDGVLTDGGMYYSEKEEILKKFNFRDAMGITLLRKNNIPTILITKERTKIVKKWSKKVKVSKLYDGVIRKESLLPEICKKFNITPNKVAYLGDDVNDLMLLQKVGFSATPNDSVSKVKKICDYICKSKSGHGVFREVADLILNEKEDKSRNQKSLK